MKITGLKKIIICGLMTFLVGAFAFAMDEALGQIILDEYTEPEKLGQPFLEEIRPFTGTVEEEAVPEAVQNAVSKYRGLTVKAYNIDGIHICDLYKDDGKKKPLLIYLHGGGENRSVFFTNVAEDEKKNGGKPSFNEYAMAGIRVITVDAAGLGDSKEGPIVLLHCVAETVRYVDHILEYYNTVEDADASKFAIRGCSMGSDTTFSYVAHGLYKPVAIITDIGMTDFTRMPSGPLFDCFFQGSNGYPYIMADMTKDQIMTFAQRYSPYHFPEKFEDVYILSGCGLDDQLHPAVTVKDFEKILKSKGYKNFKFVYEKNHGHWITNNTIQNSLSFLKKTLLK